MDTISLVPMFKMKKLNEKDDAHGSDRSLNDFPDAILKHILSFLVTKCAVRTSVLCKRWEYMWTSLPNLRFVENEIEQKELDGFVNRKQFMSFVDRVLIFHGIAQIQKFHLACNVTDDVSLIKTWISFAVRHDTREFDISLCNVFTDDDQRVLPHCLFSCESVEVLDLLGFFRVLLPSQIYLPHLKILSIAKFTFKAYHSTNLLFASPSLKELIITDCRWEGERHEFIISSPKLYHLTIKECDEPYSTVELGSRSVTISSPKLQTFDYSGGFVKAYHFNRPSSIWKATLNFHTFMKVEEMRIDHFDEVLKSIKFVKHLEISPSFVQALSCATVPIFKRLTLLEITYPIDLSCKDLEIILNKCPRLETLTFFGGISSRYDVDRLLNSNFVCLASTLKCIKIGEYEGNMKELFALQILLKKASLLESMYITFMPDVPETEKKEIEDFLSTFPRASKSCTFAIDFAL